MASNDNVRIVENCTNDFVAGLAMCYKNLSLRFKKEER